MAGKAGKKRPRKRSRGAKYGKPTEEERFKFGSMSVFEFQNLPRGKVRDRAAYVRMSLSASRTNAAGHNRKRPPKVVEPPPDPAVVAAQAAQGASDFAAFGVNDPSGMLEAGFVAAGGMEAFRRLAFSDPQGYFKQYLVPALQKRAEKTEERIDVGADNALALCEEWLRNYKGEK